MKKRIIAFIMVLSLMMLASVPSSGAETGTGTSAQPPLENTDASLLPDDRIQPRRVRFPQIQWRARVKRLRLS